MAFAGILRWWVCVNVVFGTDCLLLFDGYVALRLFVLVCCWFLFWFTC